MPTHFYKVVLAESKSRLPFGSCKVAVGAFVMPNDQIQPDMPLTAFSVPLEMLENVAGTVQLQLVMLPLAGSNLVCVQTGCKQSLGHACCHGCFATSIMAANG